MKMKLVPSVDTYRSKLKTNGEYTMLSNKLNISLFKSEIFDATTRVFFALFRRTVGLREAKSVMTRE